MEEGAELPPLPRLRSVRCSVVVEELDVEGAVAGERESPLRVVIEAERTDALQAARDRLPDRQRELVGTLLSEPDASYDDISPRLGMPLGSIGPTRRRARSNGYAEFAGSPTCWPTSAPSDRTAATTFIETRLRLTPARADEPRSASGSAAAPRP